MTSRTRNNDHKEVCHSPLSGLYLVDYIDYIERGRISDCRRDFRLSEKADRFIAQGEQFDGIRQKTGEYE